MPTRNEIDSDIPIEVSKGGTEKVSFTAYAPICGGTTAIGALQNTATAGLVIDILTSSGAGALPVWIPTITYFEQLAADPGSPIAGDTWYNTTSDLFKGAVGTGLNVWVALAAYPAQITLQIGASGTSSDALTTGDNGVVWLTQRYEYITDSYSSKALRTYLSIVGSVTGTSWSSALSFGGLVGGTLPATTATELYDGGGDAWSTKNTLNLRRNYQGKAGDPSDALTFAGRTDAGAPLALTASTERYDGPGNAWTTKSNLSAPRNTVGGTGTAPDALAVGGLNLVGTRLDIVERYDGVGDSWSTKAVISALRHLIGCSGPAGDAMKIGGHNATETDVTEIYDGVGDSWSFGPVTNVTHASNGCAGSSSSDAITISGTGSVSPMITEKLLPGVSIVTFTTT